MNSKLLIGSLALGLLFSGGCTKRFDTINQNPNQPDHINNEQLFLPAIIKNSVRNYSKEDEKFMFPFLHIWIHDVWIC